MQFGFHQQRQLMGPCDFVEQSIIWCPCELCSFAECDVMQHHKDGRDTFLVHFVCIDVVTVESFRRGVKSCETVLKFSEPPLILKYVESWRVRMTHHACNAWDYSTSRLNET